MTELDPKERARWVAAIREAPDDDDLRLRCAKWFASHNDEQHRARAEFILTQVERARLPIDDPRHAELHQRELELLARHGTQWCSAHPSLRRPIFRRGFIEYLHLHLQDFLSHRRAFFALEPVRDVRFTGFLRAKPSLVSLVAQCKELEHLHSLRLHHPGPHKDPDDRVLTLLESPHLRNLRELYTTFCGFTNEGSERFLALRILDQLTVLEWPARDRFDWNARWDFHSAAERIRTLSVSRSFRSFADLQTNEWKLFTQMPHWHELTSLDFYCGVSDEFEQLLATALPRNLQQLTLPSFPGFPAQELVERLRALPLRSLSLLEQNPAQAQALRAILPDAQWKLTHLTANDPSAASELFSSPVTRHLHSLELESSDELLRALTASPLTPGALVRFNQSSYESGIDAALSAFLRSPIASSLVSLSLGGLESDELIEAVVALPRLTHLRVWLGNAVSPRGLQLLRERAIPCANVRIQDGAAAGSPLQVLYTDGSAPHTVPLDGYVERTTDLVFQPQ